MPHTPTPADEVFPPDVFAARRLEASRRRHRVAKVRQAIEVDEYENELKVSIAADRLLDALFEPPRDE